MKFRTDVIGEVDVKDNGDKCIKKKNAIGDPKVCKTLFSEEPIRKLPMGHWFEIRCDDVQLGFSSFIGIGFTGEDPATIEGDLPARANNLPDTYLIGYYKALYWNGVKLDLETDPWVDILPRRLNRVGCLLTPTGHLCIYVDRVKMIKIDPGSEGLEKIDLDKPLYAVIDMWGGARQLTVQNSLPPTEEEEAAALEAKTAKSTAGGKKEKAADAEEAAPAKEGEGEGEAKKEGEEGAAEAAEGGEAE
eukprot:gnl/MRDRNA2_/MRDRNA2_86934_c0_seq1.p1 gnl/MRDRNA2_/MRDRNA2_86934_c0~~gnl/MRDRNA2_/MRDRNA2_86934_c0_seq1.p1  ORF type:complete len:247 (+),score=71.31 gnl/MRDRNA2_/MRDRNA2_86934_c0_seq1:93-833(+)